MKTFVPRFASHLSLPHFLLAMAAVFNVFSGPSPACGAFVCRTGEQMMCYVADGLSYVKDNNCIFKIDKVFDRSIKACHKMWSHVEGETVTVTNVIEVLEKKTNDSFKEGGGGGRLLRGLNERRPRLRLLGKDNARACRMCVTDPVTDCETEECTNRARRKRRRRALLSSSSSSVAAAVATAEHDNVRFLLADGHYDLNGIAHCLDTVMTFEAQPACPGVEVTNGIYSKCLE